MPESSDDRYRAYWDAIRARVCSVCLDAADDGTCRLARGHLCPITERLPRLVEILEGVKSGRMDEYVDAVESLLCPSCENRGPDGRCRYRHSAECALYTYLPLVLDAIEAVDGRPAA